MKKRSEKTLQREKSFPSVNNSYNHRPKFDLSTDKLFLLLIFSSCKTDQNIQFLSFYFRTFYKCTSNDCCVVVAYPLVHTLRPPRHIIFSLASYSFSLLSSYISVYFPFQPCTWWIKRRKITRRLKSGTLAGLKLRKTDVRYKILWKIHGGGKEKRKKSKVTQNYTHE